MLDAKPVDRFQNTVSVVLPIRRVSHRQIVSPTDLVQVNKLVSMFDDLQTAFCVQCRLKADPGKDTGIVKPFQGRNTVARERSASLPFEAERIIKTGKRRRKGVTVGAEQIKVTERPLCAFGECANCQAVFLQQQQNVASQAVVRRVVRVGCERKHHLFGDAQGAVLVGVLAQ